MANFSLATSESWKDRETGQRRERTDWHQVVVYSEPLANLAETALRKGSRVYVEGQLLNRKWKDQKGEERQTNEVVLSQTRGVMIVWEDRKPTPEPDEETPF
jgi:single-strand DNA-binding protein